MPNRRVTIKQVAHAAGVSTQTVSRVINDRPDVASETRRRVIAVIDDLGFQPSAVARSLIRQRSHALGVVTAGLEYVGPARSLSGIAKQAEALGYSLLLIELPDFEIDEISPTLNHLLARQVDGIIWAVPEVGSNRAWVSDHLPSLATPIVFITMHENCAPQVTVVAADNYLGGRLATEHLLEQGYRCIGHLAGPQTWSEARQRKAGWQDALAQAGLAVTDREWTQGNWSSESGYHAFEQLLGQYPEMDAVFAGNDQMALSVLQIASRRGLCVPEDLGVVGFDNIPESAHFTPALTTIKQDLQELGRTAVKEIVCMIESARRADRSPAPAAFWQKPSLIERESSRSRRQQ